jgi:hypothetical protein
MKVNTIWSTGVDNNNAPLPAGTRDTHWRTLQAPPSIFHQVNPFSPVVHPFTLDPPGVYEFDPSSRWLWSNKTGAAEGTMDTGPGAPVYIFQTEFLIDYDNAKIMQISGKWAVDNGGFITIDMTPLSPVSTTGEISIPVDGSGAGYGGFHPFTIMAHIKIGANPLVPLRIGEGPHTLDVWVYNYGNPGIDPSNPAGFNVNNLAIKFF